MPMTIATHFDSQSFDQSDWRYAESIGREIVAAVEQRDAIVQEEALDLRFCLPASNWNVDSTNQLYPAYRLISKLRPDDIRFLRIRSQAFSGYSLLYMDFNQGRSSIAPIDESIVDLIPSQPTDTLLEHWRHLSKSTPRKFWNVRPHALGEAGWWLDDGVLLNQDTISYQERLTLMYRAGLFDFLSTRRSPRVLEIGGGYGSLALSITSALPDCEYVICDIPEALLFSGLYLVLAAKKRLVLGLEQSGPGAIALLSNYRFDRLQGRGFDLVINTLSLSEMSDYQANIYARGVRDLIGAEGLFFEQNQDNRHVGFIDCKDTLASLFSSRRSLSLPDVPLTQGKADVWSNYQRL